jgi:hypothetical protein
LAISGSPWATSGPDHTTIRLGAPAVKERRA